MARKLTYFVFIISAMINLQDILQSISRRLSGLQKIIPVVNRDGPAPTTCRSNAFLTALSLRSLGATTNNWLHTSEVLKYFMFPNKTDAAPVYLEPVYFKNATLGPWLFCWLDRKTFFDYYFCCFWPWLLICCAAQILSVDRKIARLII